MCSIGPPRPCAEDSRRPGDAGFTVVEVLVAIAVLVIGLLGALVLLNTANGTTLANKARTNGVNLARQVAEASQAVQRSVPYSRLTDGCPAPSSPENPCSTTSALVSGLQAQPGLASDPGGPAGTWRVTREDITYEIEVSACSMDDPTDGAGSHSSGGPFCADAGAAGSADTAPDDYKRVIVDVSWSGVSGASSTRAVALLRSDGGNPPAVTCLRRSGDPCPVTAPLTVTDTTPTSIPFTATVAGPANRVVWYVDGEFRGTVNPSGTTASFSWELGAVGAPASVVDGTYQVSASAFDVNGESGSNGTIQVQVNRRNPPPPGGFSAGRNTFIAGNESVGGVDLDWLPVPDEDVLFYRIYSQAGSAPAQIVGETSGSAVTSFIDRDPPANTTTWSSPCSNPRQAASSTLTYYVVAVDLSGTTEREGVGTQAVDVNACNTPPQDPPADALTLTNNPDGTLTLTGALPAAPSDPDAGDSVSAVRIYRWSDPGNPADVADRLDLVPVTGGSFTYTDRAPRPNGEEQKYCFTNIDQRMQESICSNVVTG